MVTVGIDSGWFTRESPGSEFKALVGVAVTVKEKDTFRLSYDEALNNLFSKYQIERKRTTYKAAFLTGQLLDKTNKFLHDFINLMENELESIDVYYTFYPSNFTQDIITCKDSYPRSISPLKFLNNICNAYPHYCLWKYIETHPDEKEVTFEIDHFSGKITPAWNSIKNIPNIKVYYSGSECNKIISFADILHRYISNNMHGKLGLGNITRCFRTCLGLDNIHSHFMGPRRDYLINMAYTDNIDIDLRHYIKHPIYWIAWQSITGSSAEKDLLEWDQKYIDLITTAEENDGCVRLYDPKDIPFILNPKMDKIFLMNSKASSIVEAVKGFAPEVEVLPPRS